MNWTSGTTGVTAQGCTTNSSGTRAGLPTAFSAVTTIVSRYTPAASPTGSSIIPSRAGAVPVPGLSSSQGAPCAGRAVHTSVPCPVLATATLSAASAALPSAAESRTVPGVSVRVAIGDGLRVSLSN